MWWNNQLKHRNIILIFLVELESYQKRIFLVKVTNITSSDIKIRKVSNFRNFLFSEMKLLFLSGFLRILMDFGCMPEFACISGHFEIDWVIKFLSTFRNHQCGRASSTELFLVDLQSCTFLVPWRHFCKKIWRTKGSII